jgi:tetratricopeptide (TPR) repeat protein
MKQRKIIAVCFLVLLFSEYSLLAQNIDSLYLQAAQKFKNGDYKKAVTLYSQLIIKEPSNPQNYSYRAWCFYELNFYKKAILDYKKALSFPNQSVNSKCSNIKLLGNCFYYEKDWEKAVIEYNKYLDYYFDDIDVNYFKAQALLYSEKYNSAIKTVTELIKLKGENNLPKDVLKNLYVIAGFSYLYSDSLINADKYCTLSENIDSTDLNILRIRAELHYRHDNHSAAIIIYNNILQKDSTLFYIKYFRAQNYYYQKNYAEAAKDFKVIEKHYLKSDNFYSMLGDCELYSKNYTKALQYYMTAIKLKPKSSTYNNNISWCYFLIKKYQDGLRYANQAILLDKNNVNALDTRGCIYYKLADYKNSIKDFDNSIYLDSTIANSYYFRGLAYVKNHNKLKACSDWEYLLKLKDYTVLEGEKPIKQLLNENCN